MDVDQTSPARALAEQHTVPPRTAEPSSQLQDDDELMWSDFEGDGAEFFARKSAESPVDPEILRLEAEVREEVEAEARKQVEDALNEDTDGYGRVRESCL